MERAAINKRKIKGNLVVNCFETILRLNKLRRIEGWLCYVPPLNKICIVKYFSCHVCSTYVLDRSLTQFYSVNPFLWFPLLPVKGPLLKCVFFAKQVDGIS